ncbi:hypothetical protein LRS13_13560 [Svornostia abyssi]|uniref:Uncharacterized protein n=1 Tax=Svornostia abyssi TaxID=2898438 RepID=A0ABY5PB77_9ACTN|nr:hypothetical protein LRS13_13560 [Parviterribacteraceae bacterium J379]
MHHFAGRGRMAVLMLVACAAAATPPTAGAATLTDIKLRYDAQMALAKNPPPATKSGVSVVIPKEGTNQLIGTVLDDPMYLPYTDVLSGTPGGYDTFMSVDPSQASPGAGEIDLWDGSNEYDLAYNPGKTQETYGGQLGDMFVAGDDRHPFYAGRTSNSAVDRDFAYAYRFDPRYSTLRVHGDPGSYRLVSAFSPWFLGQSGVAVFYRKGSINDMVAFVEGVTTAQLRARMQRAVPADPKPRVPGAYQSDEPGVSNLGYIETDPEGNAYQTSQCSSLPKGFTGEGSYCVAKFDPAGKLVWGRKLGSTRDGDGPWGEFVWRLVYDRGFVYLAGATQSAYGGPKPPGGLQGLAAIVVKLDASTGQQVAVRQVAPANGHSVSWSMTKDDAGHLYVAGGTGSSTLHPIPPIVAPFVTKLNMSDLSSLWIDSPADGQGELISAEALGGIAYIPGDAPGEGKVFATGYTAVGTYLGADWRSNDVFWVRYDTDGTYEGGGSFGPPREHDGPWQTEVDGDGNVYVVGATNGSMDGEPFKGRGDGFVRKMRPDGTHLWTRLIGTGGSDVVHGLRIVGDTLYLSGDSEGSLDGVQSAAGGSDVFVAKMDTDGRLLGVRQFGTEGLDNTFQLGVAGDRLLIGGHTEGSMTRPFSGGLDVFVTSLQRDTLAFSPAG